MISCSVKMVLFLFLCLLDSWMMVSLKEISMVCSPYPYPFMVDDISNILDTDDDLRLFSSFKRN